MTATLQRAPLPRIIALVGPTGSGKSTLARILHECHGYRRHSGLRDMRAHRRYVIEDTWLPDEAAALRELGAVLVWVDADESTRAARLIARDGNVGDRHATGSALDAADCDISITNGEDPLLVVEGLVHRLRAGAAAAQRHDEQGRRAA